MDCYNGWTDTLLLHTCRTNQYNLSTNFRLEVIEPPAREVFIFWTLVEREERGDV